MKRTIATLTATTALVLGLAACGSGPERLVCIDKVTGYAFDEDDQCDPDDDDYRGLGVFLVMTAKQYGTWKDSSNKYDRRLTGLKAPTAGDKMRTVYSTKKKVKVKNPATKSRSNTTLPKASTKAVAPKPVAKPNTVSKSTGRRK